jgi:hypothetical protein
MCGWCVPREMQQSMHSRLHGWLWTPSTSSRRLSWQRPWSTQQQVWAAGRVDACYDGAVARPGHTLLQFSWHVPA